MDDNKVKQAKDIITNAAKEDQDLKDAFNDTINELEKLERKMAEIAETLLGNRKVQKENAGFVGSEADSIMLALAREQSKHDPEVEALLKELNETKKQIAGLTDILSSV